MTAGAQGHPGWVDNHPTSLKFLAASQACLHTNTYSRLRPTITERHFLTHPDSHGLDQDVMKNSRQSHSPKGKHVDDPISCYPVSSVLQTATNPSITYKPKVINTFVNRELHQDIFLPQSIAELLLSTACQNFPGQIDPLYISMFSNVRQCTLRKVDLRSSKLTDNSIQYLLKHKLTHLDVRDCPLLTCRSFIKINCTCPSLISLSVCKNIFDGTELIFTLPELRYLTLSNLDLKASKLKETLKHSQFEKLISLDLSGSSDVGDASGLARLQLVNLALYNCKTAENYLDNIAKITSLRLVGWYFSCYNEWKIIIYFECH